MINYMGVNVNERFPLLRSVNLADEEQQFLSRCAFFFVTNAATSGGATAIDERRQ